MENIIPRESAFLWAAGTWCLGSDLQMNELNGIREQIAAEAEEAKRRLDEEAKQKIASIDELAELHREIEPKANKLGRTCVLMPLKGEEKWDANDRAAWAIVLLKAPMNELQRLVLASKSRSEAKDKLLACEFPASLFTPDERSYLPNKGPDRHGLNALMAEAVLSLPIAGAIGLMADPKNSKRDRSGRKGKSNGPISQVLDFSYADKKEALVFILCGASYDDKSEPSYEFPAQVYDNQGTRAKVPPGSFILPKYLVDAGRLKREEANKQDNTPTIFTLETAKLIDPPDIMLGEFAEQLELPYTWVIYLFTIQVEKIPKALRLVERRTANTWRMTPLAWNAFMQRRLDHIRTLAGHFSRIVRTAHDPNAWTAAQLQKPEEERPKIDKAHAVGLARKVKVDQAMIQRAYEDLKIPANLRDPVKPDELAASLAALQEPGE